MPMIKQDRESWKTSYERGEWDFLSGSMEHVRYAVIASYIHRFQRPLSLLDVGCGEGIMLKYIDLNYVENIQVTILFNLLWTRFTQGGSKTDIFVQV